MTLADSLKVLSESGQVFSLFRFPAEEELYLALGLFQDEEEASACFIMQPFMVGEERQLRIGKEYIGRWKDFKLDTLQIKKYESLTNQGFDRKVTVPYLQQCERAIQEIRKGILQKVVLHAERQNPTERTAAQLFMKALENYPEAMVHWTCIPGKNDWIGASPELLLSREGSSFHTMSLAGTRTAEGEGWTEKEFREQELVTAFIAETLAELAISDVEYSARYDKAAGHLFHLCTEVSFRTNKEEAQILGALHPTPAICGSPRKEALELLHELGMDKRSYYCGFVGMRSEQLSRFYVNLRCMESRQGQVRIYVGGGITADSDPQAELEELNIKAQVMGRIL